jgi:hypothetical protein
MTGIAERRAKVRDVTRLVVEAVERGRDRAGLPVEDNEQPGGYMRRQAIHEVRA